MEQELYLAEMEAMMQEAIREGDVVAVDQIIRDVRAKGHTREALAMQEKRNEWSDSIDSHLDELLDEMTQ